MSARIMIINVIYSYFDSGSVSIKISDISKFMFRIKLPLGAAILFEPVHEEINNLHMRNQSRRSASR